jgi:hypothetical protein
MTNIPIVLEETEEDGILGIQIYWSEVPPHSTSGSGSSSINIYSDAAPETELSSDGDNSTEVTGAGDSSLTVVSAVDEEAEIDAL